MKKVTFESGLGAAGALFGAFGTATSIAGSAKADKMSATGSRIAADYFRKAATATDVNARLAEVSGAIQLTQANREIFRAVGGQQSDVAGAGFTGSGSAIDLMRASMAEGALQRQIIQNQTAIEVRNFEQQADSFRGQAEGQDVAAGAQDASAASKKKSGLLGTIGSVISIGASLFSDARLKRIFAVKKTLANGVQLVEFEYKSQPDVRYYGVIAQQVKEVVPAAVFRDVSGYYRVDYEAIGVKMIKVPKEAWTK